MIVVHAGHVALALGFANSLDQVRRCNKKSKVDSGNKVLLAASEPIPDLMPGGLQILSRAKEKRQAVKSIYLLDCSLCATPAAS